MNLALIARRMQRDGYTAEEIDARLADLAEEANDNARDLELMDQARDDRAEAA